MKKVLQILLLALAVSANVFGQAPNWAWAKSAGNSEYLTCTATDGLGNVYVAGTFNSSSITFGTHTLYNTGVTDIYIVKYDETGYALWARSAGSQYTNPATPTGDYAYSIAADSLGNVYVSGIFFGASITFGAITLHKNYNNSRSNFIVKYDDSGNVLWAKSPGSIYDNNINSLATDAIGNLYITGNYIAFISFGNIVLTNSGNMDIFIAKYDGMVNAI